MANALNQQVLYKDALRHRLCYLTQIYSIHIQAKKNTIIRATFTQIQKTILLIRLRHHRNLSKEF